MMFLLIGPYAQKLHIKQLKEILKNKNIIGIVTNLSIIPAPNTNKHTASVIIEYLMFIIDKRYEFFTMSFIFKLTNIVIGYKYIKDINTIAEITEIMNIMQ